jgi:hypothetical protein
MNWAFKAFSPFQLIPYKNRIHLYHLYCGTTIHIFTNDDLGFDLDQAHHEIELHRQDCVMYTGENNIMGKQQPKGDSGKAPNTGSNTQSKSDNKMTADGKPVDPNRPHVDK